MIKVYKDTFLIKPENLLHIHSIYCQPMQDNNFSFHNNPLKIKDYIVYSTRAITLIIIPINLCKTIFVWFHVNPLGGHYLYYYTLHYVRLRYNWSSMARDILSWITICAHCLLRTGTSKPTTELLYTFTIHVLIVTVHINAWVPKKTMSLDGNIGIMIAICHITGFVALGPFKTATYKSFATIIYPILLRHRLPHCLITDPGSNFK